MAKRLFALWVVVFFLLPFAVSADLITRPDNDFFNRYEADCVYLGRRFSVVGADGYAPLKKNPGSNQTIHEIQNGETVCLEYSCLYQGEFWGLLPFYAEESSDGRQGYGWVKIDGQLLVLYDYVAFAEEHLDELYSYGGNYDGIKKTGAAIAWPWPGADSMLWTVEDIDTTSFKVLYAYRDAQGREWGFVTYFYGSPNIWVCLDDPLNRDIPAFHPAPEPAVWHSDTAHNEIGASENSGVTLMVLLVAALVVGTIILIKIFWKPSDTGGNRNE